MDTSRSAWLTVSSLRHFIISQQMEMADEADCIKIIQDHEPDQLMKSRNQMSFDGFTRYLLDSRNFAFVPEEISMNPDEMQYPLSYYYVASSHNTYLTGHQLKGDSRAELYRQVLLTGCRCVELDCWDGDDGYPVIYHGHTFTSKISFRQAIDIINKSAFVTSLLPVILSIENHCSLQQQIKMATIFKSVFGDRLVSNFMFDSDLTEHPRLPTPMQLQHKILIKNKKLVMEPMPYYHLSTAQEKPIKEVVSSPQPLSRKFSKNSFASSTGDEEEDEEFDDLDDLPDEEEEDPLSSRSRAPSESPIPSRKVSQKQKKPPPLSIMGRQETVNGDTSSLPGALIGKDGTPANEDMPSRPPSSARPMAGSTGSGRSDRPLLTRDYFYKLRDTF